MSDVPTLGQQLDEIRQEIDEIDSTVLGLLGERFFASERIRQVKAGAPDARVVMPYRPGREAIVLRRLMEEAAPGIPLPVIVRVWRSIMSASMLAQADVRIVATGDTQDKTEMRTALADFASHIPVEVVKTADEAIAMLAPDQPVLAAVKLKSNWPELISKLETQSVPRIVTVLPGAPGRPSQLIGILGFALSEQTGDDETLVQSAGKLPRDFVPKPVWQMKISDDIHLTALPGYFDMTEQPLLSLKGNRGLALQVAGRYPNALEL